MVIAFSSDVMPLRGRIVERTQADLGCAAERHYANTLHIGFNSTEFLLDFAQVYDGAPLALHTRLVSSPIHAKQFSELLVD